MLFINSSFKSLCLEMFEDPDAGSSDTIDVILGCLEINTCLTELCVRSVYPYAHANLFAIARVIKYNTTLKHLEITIIENIDCVRLIVNTLQENTTLSDVKLMQFITTPRSFKSHGNPPPRTYPRL